MNGSPSFASRRWPILFGILWIAAIAWGSRILWAYKTTPGVAGKAMKRWPQESRVPRARGQATLIMLAHPHCPCTQASVDELAVMMARLQGRLRAYVLFYQPAGRPDDWIETPLWRSAAAIPGVGVWRDRGGVEADRFGARTSGQALLYDPKGTLLFEGGITEIRGHAGDNAGSRAIIALLMHGKTDATSTPVFGCSIKGSTSTGAKDHGNLER